MNSPFQVNFRSVFGFDVTAAAVHFGVHRRTIGRWLDGSAPVFVQRYMAVMARGWLPDYRPYNQWQIVGEFIYTPFGRVSAFDAELAARYRTRLDFLESHLSKPIHYTQYHL